MKKVISLLLCLLMLASLSISANAMRIQHNISALNAHRNLTNNNYALTKNLEKLSNGYRINRAGDDTANPSMTEKMRAQIATLDGAGAQNADNEKTVLSNTWKLMDVESEWYYLYADDGKGSDQDRSDLAREMWEIESIGRYVNGEDGQVPDQDDLEGMLELARMQMFSGLYGQNNTPQGMFTGVSTPNGVNGVGYETNEKGRLDASYQIVLTKDQQIIVNDNPRTALANTQGDVTFYEEGAVNIGVFDEDGNVVHSFSIQVNEDGTLATASYANQLLLQLGDTGDFQTSFNTYRTPFEEWEESFSDWQIASEIVQYTRNNSLMNAANAMLAQANQVPQGVLQMLQ